MRDVDAGLRGPSPGVRQVAGKPLAGAEQPDPHRIARAAEDHRDLPVVEALPGAEGQQFPVGYVPQEGALFPHLTVAANVGFGLPARQVMCVATLDGDLVYERFVAPTHKLANQTASLIQ